MKHGLMTMTVMFCILTIGCQEDVHKDSSNHLIYSQLVKSYNDIAIQNAIVSQHTLFPYHFVKNGAELNELGRRDLAALTSHFIKHPGQLNIRRHNTTADLYEARVNMVHERLQEAGIDLERISISDGMPGGSGVASERILIILERASEGTSTATSTSFSSGAN
ncbi:MAG: hypothetical protein ACYS3S_12115 [Planctomycetota bacterium]|jgi:hypothetical protein